MTLASLQDHLIQRYLIQHSLVDLQCLNLFIVRNNDLIASSLVEVVLGDNEYYALDLFELNVSNTLDRHWTEVAIESRITSNGNGIVFATTGLLNHVVLRSYQNISFHSLQCIVNSIVLEQLLVNSLFVSEISFELTSHLHVGNLQVSYHLRSLWLQCSCGRSS